MNLYFFAVVNLLVGKIQFPLYKKFKFGRQVSASYQDITGLFDKLILHLFHIHYRYILQTHEQHLVIGTGLPTQGPSNGEFLSLLLLLILLLLMLLLAFCNCFCFVAVLSLLILFLFLLLLNLQSQCQCPR